MQSMPILPDLGSPSHSQKDELILALWAQVQSLTGQLIVMRERVTQNASIGLRQVPLLPPGSLANPMGKSYQAKKTLTGAKACRVVDVRMDEAKTLIRQTGYSCQYPAVLKLDKALRTQLTRCVAGETDDDSDPYEFTIWVDRISSGEGYRGTEVSVQVNMVDGLNLWVRQTVCTNKGKGQACAD